MIENSLSLQLKGLRPHKRLNRNSGLSEVARNVEVTKLGLQAYEPITPAISWDILGDFGIDYAWPFPAIYRGKKNTFLLSGDRIFDVDNDSWDLTEIDLYDSQTGVAALASVGGFWQFVDFYDTYMFTNGQNTIFHTNLSAISGNADKVYVDNNVRIRTGCAFRGRVVFGGFDPSYSWSSSWKTFIDSWAKKIPTVPATTYDLDFRQNFVWWSSIGGGDALWLFYQAYAQDGNYTDEYSSTRPLIWDTIKKNQMGWAVMPFQGPVLSTKVLGGDIVVYGEDGVAGLRPHGHIFGISKEGELDDLGDIGIHNEASVGGNDRVQLAVAADGSLWLIEAGLKVTKLGYEEFTEDMLGSDIVVSYTPKGHLNSSGKFHISNGWKTLLFTIDGLSEVSQHTTSKVYVGGEVLGIAIDDTDGDQSAEIQTTEISIGGQRALRHIGWIEVENNISAFVSYEARLIYRYAGKVDWQQTDWQPLNFKGATYFGISAHEFKIDIRCSDFRQFNFGHVVIRYQSPDKVTKRGSSPVGIGGIS